MTKGHLWKPPLAEDLTSPRAGRALCPHSATAEAWDVAMRHSAAKYRRVSGALRQRALPIMDTATAVENGFPEVPKRVIVVKSKSERLAERVSTV